LTGNISAHIMYSRGTVGISHHITNDLSDTLFDIFGGCRNWII